MITPEQALLRILALGAPLTEQQDLPLVDCLNRYAACPIPALRTQPARDQSAMDGYAIRWADLPGPWTITGESAAGRSFKGACADHEAIRIFTGAALPAAADTILVQEDCARDGDILTLTGDGPACKGAHVRPQGGDFRAGQILLERGDRITPARIGLAALAGDATLPVTRLVRIALISTGNELGPIGQALNDDQIPSSNGVTLSALLAQAPATIVDFGIIKDDRAALTRCFHDLASFDVIVTSGGASIGDHDLVRPALLDADATLDFWKIAMRPGKPLLAGRLGNAIVLGLPGNPVSAFVTAMLFLLPLVRHLCGARNPGPVRQSATLTTNLAPNGPRTDYQRAICAGDTVTPIEGDSGMLRALASANALIEVPPHSATIQAGCKVSIISLA
jgi:molybdopterin molybdotransferase